LARLLRQRFSVAPTSRDEPVVPLV